MPYSRKNALVDLGFIDAVCYFGDLPMPPDIRELLLNSLDSVEDFVFEGRLSGDTLDPHRDAKLLHHLGWIRGVLWKTPVPHALHEAIDRVVNFATRDENFALDITGGDDRPEPGEEQLSADQRHAVLAEGEKGLDAWSGGFARSIGAPHAGVLDFWRRYGALGSDEIAEELAKESATPAACEPLSPERTEHASSWTPERRAAQADRARNRPPLLPDDALEAVKADWEAGLTFALIGRRHGCSGGHIRNFLKKHGIDPRRAKPDASEAAEVGDASPGDVCEIYVKPDVFEMLTSGQGESRPPLH